MINRFPNLIVFSIPYGKEIISDLGERRNMALHPPEPLLSKDMA